MMLLPHLSIFSQPLILSRLRTNKRPGAFDDPNGAHIMIEVVSDKFAGKRPVQRQQMVYKALWEELKDPGGIVHAVDGMTCQTPDEAGS